MGGKRLGGRGERPNQAAILISHISHVRAGRGGGNSCVKYILESSKKAGLKLKSLPLLEPCLRNLLLLIGLSFQRKIIFYFCHVKSQFFVPRVITSTGNATGHIQEEEIKLTKLSMK